jgi:hemin uptake protein HemP
VIVTEPERVVPRRREATEAPPAHDARELTRGGTEAEIRLDGVRYVLRITRQGKLILTK